MPSVEAAVHLEGGRGWGVAGRGSDSEQSERYTHEKHSRTKPHVGSTAHVSAVCLLHAPDSGRTSSIGNSDFIGNSDAAAAAVIATAAHCSSAEHEVAAAIPVRELTAGVTYTRALP
jgi:hypothetical protein